MDLVESQFERLRKKYPAASLKRNPGGISLVTVPKVNLVAGWDSKTTTVYFVVPAGYPMARPDTFWTDTLHLSNGAAPQSTGSNDGHGLGRTNLTWFSWHLTTWDPNRDDLLNYMNAIEQRLKSPL